MVYLLYIIVVLVICVVLMDLCVVIYIQKNKTVDKSIAYCYIIMLTLKIPYDYAILWPPHLSSRLMAQFQYLHQLSRLC